MTEYFEIILGESIGFFKLGMTRKQIEELDIRPRMDLNKKGTHYPLVDIDVEVEGDVDSESNLIKSSLAAPSNHATTKPTKSNYQS